MIVDTQDVKSSEMNIFVYGSLARGNIHYSKFFNEENITPNVFVKGSAYRLEVGYSVISTQGSQRVPGDLIKCNRSDVLLSLLDQFHGFSFKIPEKSLFLRMETDVYLDNGFTEKAYVYSINPLKLPKTAKLIESGNWMEDFAQNPPLTEKLKDREKEYIRKLGNSSGRDIVPIQLDLYRGLMNMGMIVDKGRRLALSKLGQEVFRYLE
ncbi:MAG: gamma-glutamylcyclotransferase family protein [Bdellovibrionota bacterium]